MGGVIEAVLFDWGGTLSTYSDFDLLAMWRAAASVLAPEDPEPVAQRLLDAEHVWWDERVGAGDGTGSGTTEDIIRSVAEATHLPVQQAIAAYHGAWEQVVDHDPDALGVLKELKARGLKTGLLSNTHWPRELHDRWLEEAGLLEHLDQRVYTSDLTHMKPHALAFTTLLDALDVAADRAVFVGDRPRDDIAGAQAVGMRTVLLTGRNVPPHDVTPTAEIPYLSGLLEVLDRW